MTGIYVRIKRNEEWEMLEIEHLTDEEREKFLESKEKDWVVKALSITCNTLNQFRKEVLKTLISK